MGKPPKTPRPAKSQIQPPRENERVLYGVGLIHEKLIGRTVIAWSKLEDSLGDLIWFLLKADIPIGRTITARMDAVGLVRMLRDLGEVALAEAEFHRLSPILDRTDIFREDRNLIVHGLWGRNSSLVPIAFTLRQKPLAPDQVVSESFDDNRMRTLIRAIDGVRGDLLLLMRDIGALPNIPSPPPPEGEQTPPQDHPSSGPR
jgi:hypothetical protein